MHRPLSQIQPIGLDLGSGSIKMLQLELQPPRDGTQEPRPAGESAAPLAVVAAATAALDDASASSPIKRRRGTWGVALGRMLAENPFVGRRVVAALPRSILHVRNLRIPSCPEFDDQGAPLLDRAAFAQAAELFPYDLSEAVVHFLYAGQVHDSSGKAAAHELIVLAAPAAAVQEFVGKLDAAGLEVASLDVQPNALFRSIERFGRRSEDGRDGQMLVDIGTRQTQVIIGRERAVGFYRSIDLGGMHLLEAIAQKLRITVAEARALRQRLRENATPAGRDRMRQAVEDATRHVAQQLGQELALCLRYHAVTFRGWPVRRVRIVGGDADDPQLMAAFSSVLPLPVEPARPLLNIDTRRMLLADVGDSAAQWALASGLALRFTQGYFPAADGAPRTRAKPQPDVELKLTQAPPAPLVLPQLPEAAVA